MTRLALRLHRSGSTETVPNTLPIDAFSAGPENDMPQVVAYKDVEKNLIDRGDRQRIGFMDPPKGSLEPMAILTVESPGRVVRPHFHVVDQWQVFTAGKCKLNREETGPYSIHFTRAYTPYGPLISDPEIGMSNLSMWATHQPGAQYVAEKRDLLASIPNRRPWQIKRTVTFPSQEGKSIRGVDLQAVPDVVDDKGLAAYSLVMGPSAKTVAPDASQSGGQYIVVVNGSVLHEGQTKMAMAVIFVSPSDGAFTLEAGPGGLEALVLNYPRRAQGAQPAANEQPVSGFKKWQCQLCAFVYDEAEGMPDDGVPPGTKWEDVPEDWSCPDCAASKAEFDMVEVG